MSQLLPYSIVKDKHFPIYDFQTDNQIIYQVSFKDSSYVFDEYVTQKIEAYEMAIQVVYNPVTQKQRLDGRIPVTIAGIFYDFIYRNKEQIVIYICDSSDNKQAIRNRKFTQWFELFKGNEFIKIDAHIIDYDRVTYFTSVILHCDNPKRQEITEVFYQLTNDQQK
jgi:Family of unknown function (DUF6169)